VILSLALFAPAGPLRAQDAAAEKIHPWVLEHTAGGGRAEFFAFMAEQADVSSAAALPTKLEKGRFVYETLRRTAERSQAPLIQWLKGRGVPYRSFFIANTLLVTGDRELALALAARGDVARLAGNPVIRNFPAPGSGPAGVSPDNARRESPSAAPQLPAAVDWNISRTHAPDLWALGYRGQGIVVGGQDTGYRWTHSFIKGKYRGWNGSSADHNYNWHDAIHAPGGSAACPADSPAPCDDYGHGTHTMGSVLGDDGAGNQVGMAPQAKWIGCRDMDVGNGKPSTYLECFQFFLAPTRLDGSGANPGKAPDLTTNSWSCPPAEGCTVWDILKTAVDNQKAAGIMTLAAAQNAGPNCGTVADPPGIYGSAYSVGATDINDTLAGFSSRGPAAGSALMKPEICAPGVNIRSAWNSSDSATTFLSGTSMATPQVAGGVALLWSALACFKNQPDLTATLLNATARRLGASNPPELCGGDYVNGPNNSWGSGLLDVGAALGGAFPMNALHQGKASPDLLASWTAVPGATAINVYRAPSPGGGWGAPVASLAGSATGWTDGGQLSSAVSQFYSVTDVNGCNIESPR
jgi:subtilisin family serine protease